MKLTIILLLFLVGTLARPDPESQALRHVRSTSDESNDSEPSSGSQKKSDSGDGSSDGLEIIILENGNDDGSSVDSSSQDSSADDSKGDSGSDSGPPGPPDPLGERNGAGPQIKKSKRSVEESSEENSLPSVGGSRNSGSLPSSSDGGLKLPPGVVNTLGKNLDGVVKAVGQLLNLRGVNSLPELLSKLNSTLGNESIRAILRIISPQTLQLLQEPLALQQLSDRVPLIGGIVQLLQDLSSAPVGILTAVVTLLVTILTAVVNALLQILGDL